MTTLTARLRLEPAGPDRVDDLWRLHQDELIAHWYGGAWSREHAEATAERMAHGWRVDGVHKWLAYHRGSGALVGRGGLSYGDVRGVRRLELGWAVAGAFRGRGYATEIGRAGLRYAADALHAPDVVAFTERHHHRSRAVMERLGMRYAGEFRRAGLVEGRAGVHDDAPFALYVAALRR